MIRYTVGDTAPDLVLELYEDGEPADLTGVLAVVLYLKKPSGAQVEAAMDVSATPTDGLVSYAPDAATFDEAGVYYGEVRRTLADGRLEHGRARFTIAVRDPFGKVNL